MGSRAARIAAAILTVAALAVFVGNIDRPLANPDEGRYSEIAREMAAGGDWVTPRLNGIKYFEKPPLQYWASAASMRLFGETEFAARLYTGLAGLGTLLAVGWTVARLGRSGEGAAAVVALAGSPYFLTLAGVVTLDMGLTLWTTATLCAWMLAEAADDPRRRRRWMLAAWAATALAVLSKGLVGLVLPAAAVALLCVVRRDFHPLVRLEWVRGPLVFLAIAAPWFIAVSSANAEFARFFFVHEHFERFTASGHRRGEPWWYFLPVCALGLLPWLFVLPSAARHAWRTEDPRLSAPLRLALLWGAFVLVFFSLSRSKLPTYILPAFPAFAMVIGHYLAQAPTRALAMRTWPVAVAGIVLAALAWRLPGTARDEWTQGLYTAAQPWALAGAAGVFTASAAGAFLLWRGRRWAGITLVALSGVLLVGGVLRGYERLTPRQSGVDIAERIRPLLTPDTRLYSVGMYDQTVPFYLRRTVTLVDYVDEFKTGLAAAPHLQLVGPAFDADWLRPGGALAIMQPHFYESMRERGLPMQVLHQDPRRILVRKP